MNGGPATGPRALLRRLREIMAVSGDPQERMDQIVSIIAANMVAEVCSVYLLRGGRLELFATEGLNADAVHQTTLQVGEGLVGLIAQLAMPFALADAPSHPNFAYRPETGEDPYHSLLGVPILRGGRVIGVLVVQNSTERAYSDDEVEAMQTIAMVLAEMSGTGGLVEAVSPDNELLPERLDGLALNDGLARGTAVLHQPRVVVERHIADDPEAEKRRLDEALVALRDDIDRMLATSGELSGGESREILETYRMFTRDRGWITRMHEAIGEELTAEAAVERVQVDTRARMGAITDPDLRERLHDLEDLANRLLRHLTGRAGSAAADELPDDAVLVARNMGPAELLDYDSSKLRALVLEEGSPTAHVVIVARALQIPVMGRIDRLLEIVDAGDPIIVDADHRQVLLRPAPDVMRAFEDNQHSRARQAARFEALVDLPAETLDGERMELLINGGLLVDMQNLQRTGAAGVGLYRTELHFMVRATLPNIATQTEFYTRVLDMAGDKPVVFRTLDVGGDKVLPYLRRFDDEQNPAMGWRAIRLALDRPVLLKMQLRALLKAAAGRDLKVMFPMVAEVAEFLRAREIFDQQYARHQRMGLEVPRSIQLGTMLEVPSLAVQLPALLPLVDFVSIGSNDLLQFLFASDRGNPRLAGRYDVLSPASLSFLRGIVDACRATDTPLSLCGEAAGRPLEAMALMAIGLRRISMNASSVGPVKSMVRSVSMNKLKDLSDDLCNSREPTMRPLLERFAKDHHVAI